MPKQFLALFDDKSLLQHAAERIEPLVSVQNRWIVSTRSQENLVRMQCPQIPNENIIFEPFGKNTAPCIGLAALQLYDRDPESIMIVLPSDHLIVNTQKFINILRDGIRLAEQYRNSLLTIGIHPTFPATGYGYIQRGKEIGSDQSKAFKVRAFAEKPSQEIAETFFNSKEFLWNSGIFVWRAETILMYLEELMPNLYASLLEIRDASFAQNVQERVYRQIRSESIDYGVMEHASEVIVLQGDFGWSDVGSWEQVYEIESRIHNGTSGNVLKGLVVNKGVNNCYVESNHRLISLLGVKDLVIIDTPDALLICNRNQTQDVKWLVEKLKHENLTQYL
jgi:mannose-1-phosphate guanylyltransferase